MNSQTTKQLASKGCLACQGNVPKYSAEQALTQLQSVPGWRLTHDQQRIRKDWQLKDFVAGIDFLDKVAQVAETEGHHPDLHLEGYRHVWIEIWTHAVGGLTESDFILAAKIDQLPVNARGRAAPG